MHIRNIIGYTLIPLSLLIPLQAWAGFEVERRNGERDMFTGQVNWKENTREYYDYAGGKAALDNIILRFDKGEIILLVPEKQAFYRNSIQGFCTDMDSLLKKLMASPMLQQAKQMMAQMRHGKANPPMMKKPKAKIYKIGPEKIAGYQAFHYQIKLGDEVIEDSWIATDARLKSLNPKQDPSIEKVNKQFGSCQKRFDQTMSDIMGGGSMGIMEAEIPDIDGFELKNRSSSDISEVVRIRKTNIPASRFEPPKTYHPIKLSDIYQIDALQP